MELLLRRSRQTSTRTARRQLKGRHRRLADHFNRCCEAIDRAFPSGLLFVNDPSFVFSSHLWLHRKNPARSGYTAFEHRAGFSLERLQSTNSQLVERSGYFICDRNLSMGNELSISF